jgi:uncharacterized membrane protein YeaQ/YmgE (transglycosylase-associated protein family)
VSPRSTPGATRHLLDILDYRTATSISLRIYSAVISTFALAEINHLFWAIAMILQLSRKVWSLVKRLAILGNFLQANDGGKIMIHLIWYILVGLIAGVIAKSVMHVHMTIFWTIVLGIIGSIIGGAVTHMFSHPTTGRFHPAGLIFSTLGAILVLYVCIRLNIHFSRVL